MRNDNFIVGSFRHGFIGLCVALFMNIASISPGWADHAFNGPAPVVSAKKAGDDRQRIAVVAPRDELGSEEIYRAQVLLGTALGIFWHEFGHALIGETGLPATGPEEDVADAFSAFVLSASVEESGIGPEEQEFMAGVVKYSSLLWYYVAQRREQSGRKKSWQDEHAPDLKRFRNSFCIIYGSNPKRYTGLARQVGLSDRTRERCRSEQRKRYRAWETILKTVSRNLGPDAQGIYPADTPGGRIHLTFASTESPTGQTLIKLLNSTGIMTHMMTEMERLFVWPRDLHITFRDCESVNAWYDGRNGSVTMCYSLVEQLSAVIFIAEGKEWNG